jgi:hypothetical protein
MNTALRSLFLGTALAGAIPFWAYAQNQADVHLAVYSTGFMVDMQRQVTYGDRARRVQIKTQAKGTAAGEMPEAGIEIDRLDQGMSYHLNPHSKTYTKDRFQESFGETGRPSSVKTGQPATITLSRIDPNVTGPSGTSTINGIPCEAYTIRLVADFAEPASGKVVARETLLEKLWVAKKAPGVQHFHQQEENFNDAISAVHGTEKADVRWVLREFNRHILEMHGNPEDFKKLQAAYQGARANVSGIPIRELAGWNWRRLDASSETMLSADEMASFVASIAGGLGAPPEEQGKKPLANSDKPRWVKELETDLGRSGPTAIFLKEVVKTRTVQASPDFFEIPNEYRPQ